MTLIHKLLLEQPDSGGSGGADADSSGDAGKAKGDTGTPDNSPGQDKKFTQAELDQHIKARLEREREKFSGYDETKKRLEEAERILKEREVKKNEEAGKYEEALELTKRGFQQDMEKLQGEAEKWKNAFTGSAIDRELMSAAMSCNAVDAEDIVLMLKGSVELDAELKPRFSDGKTIADGVKAYLDAKPHLVKAGHRPGGSGTEMGGGQHNKSAPTNDKPISQMTVEEVRALGGRGILERQAATGTPWATQAQRRQEKE